MLTLDTLETIKRIEDDDVRFLAVVGACMSAASLIETALYRCYSTASKKDREEATRAFYRVVNFDHKRKVTNLAVSEVVTGKNSKRWSDLNSEAQALLGREGARNLAGHNSPDRRIGSYTVYWSPGTRHPFTGKELQPKQEWLDDPLLEYKMGTSYQPYFSLSMPEAEIIQNYALVEAGMRPAQRKTQAELLSDVERMIILHQDLVSFLHDVLQKTDPQPH